MKKAQVWYLDFIIGLSLFILISVLAFKYISVRFSDAEAEKGKIWDDAYRLTDSLLSPGIPSNWTRQDAVSLGISSDTNVLDMDKLERLKNFTKDGYDRTKLIFGIKSDYLVHFEDKNGVLLNLSNQSYIGKPGMNDASAVAGRPSDSLYYERYLVYRHDSVAEIITMKVLVWQQ
jgi:hypothetical protein